MMTTYYGAYGANLNKQEMHVRCPAARPVERINLVDRMLVFKGVADMIKDPGKRTPIGVYEITENCERALDQYESYPFLYGKEYLNVRLSRGPTQIMIYVMNDGYGFGTPANQYFQVIRQGYNDWGIEHANLHAALRHSIKNDQGDSYRSRRWEE